MPIRTGPGKLGPNTVTATVLRLGHTAQELPMREGPFRIVNMAINIETALCTTSTILVSG